MKKRFLRLTLSAIFLSNLVFSQEKCASYKGYLQDDIQKHPEFYKKLESQNAELEKSNKDFLKNIARTKTTEGKRIIPVVVHVVYASSNGAENLPESDIQNALDALNKNINGQSDKFLDLYQGLYPKTPDIFAALRGEANVEFRLAKLDPLGNPTNGIVRVQSDLTNGADPNNLVKTVSYWNSYQYFNIWVVRNIESSNGGVTLGYAQFPSGGFMSTDGVVILFSQMNDPLSTTLTHEVGHWLGLCHTWDCGGGTCGTDNVQDTPPQHTSNGFTTDPAADPATPTPAAFPWHVGLPSGTFYGCEADSLNPAGEMFMNFMDYTNDNFCTMFSKGQVDVMNQTLIGDTTDYGFRVHIWSDDNITATGTADGYKAPTCTKVANFSDGFANDFSSICLGEDIWLKSNKTSVFANNINSLSWDLGDGGSGSFSSGGTNDDNSLYTFANPGTYDISIVIDYEETTEARAYNLFDLDLSNATSYDSIVSTLIVQGTQAELDSLDATNITIHSSGYLGSYWGFGPTSTYYRGEIEEKMYVAYYTNSCISTTVNEGFITVLPTTASNNSSSYSYSFENASDLNGDWVVNATENGENIWDFTSFEDKVWEHAPGVAIDGNASIMMAAKDGMTLGTSSIISAAYDLSNFTTPAIQFSWSGAAVSSPPVNELKVYYSNDCGEDWLLLGALTNVEVANAGLYNSNFSPKSSEWNDTIMSKNQLKNDNIRFKIEYITNGSSNNFYIDNINIGEAASLLQTLDNSARMGVYPNPTSGETNIVIENLADKNVQVKLTNILGAQVQLMYDGMVVSKRQTIDTDLSYLEDGIYFITVYSEGKAIITDKLILFR